MLSAAARGAWAASSAGAPAPSLRTPPFACSPKDHIQTQIARLHPPPPVKSIIRRCSPACGLLFLGRERERDDGERGEGGAGGGIAFDSCYFSDWKGLAGKGTWYKGCAQQGWSECVCVCVRCRSSQHRARALSVQRAGGAQRRGYGGREASLELSTLVRLPAGSQETLARWVTRVQAAAAPVPMQLCSSGPLLQRPLGCPCPCDSFGARLGPCTAHLHPRLVLAKCCRDCKV